MRSEITAQDITDEDPAKRGKHKPKSDKYVASCLFFYFISAFRRLSKMLNTKIGKNEGKNYKNEDNSLLKFYL